MYGKILVGDILEIYIEQCHSMCQCLITFPYWLSFASFRQFRQSDSCWIAIISTLNWSHGRNCLFRQPSKLDILSLSFFAFIFCERSLGNDWERTKFQNWPERINPTYHAYTVGNWYCHFMEQSAPNCHPSFPITAAFLTPCDDWPPSSLFPSIFSVFLDFNIRGTSDTTTIPFPSSLSTSTLQEKLLPIGVPRPEHCRKLISPICVRKGCDYIVQCGRHRSFCSQHHREHTSHISLTFLQSLFYVQNDLHMRELWLWKQINVIGSATASKTVLFWRTLEFLVLLFLSPQQ